MKRGQHGPVPVAVGQLGQPLRARVVEPTVVDAEQPAQLAPALGAAQVHHDGAAVGRVEDAQDGRLGVAHDAGPVSLAVEDRCRVEEEQPVEQRRLDVLAVAGRLALDQRGAGAEHRQQRGGHAGHREGEPDRVVAGEETLLCAGPGVDERLPSRLVARRAACCPRRVMEHVTRRGPAGPGGRRAESEPSSAPGRRFSTSRSASSMRSSASAPARVGAQVELDRPLAPVPGGEAGRVGPLRVAARPLDLHHLGAQVGEDRRGQRRGHVLADLDAPSGPEHRLSGHRRTADAVRRRDRPA